MCDKDRDKLRALLARKEELIKMKRIIIERSAENNNMNSSESIIDNSDIETESHCIAKNFNRPNIIINNSSDTIENDEEFSTSTISLPKSHSYFNEQHKSSTEDNHFQSCENNNYIAERPFSYISEAMHIIQNEETLNVVTDNDATRSDVYAMPDLSCEVNHEGQVENIQIMQTVLSNENHKNLNNPTKTRQNSPTSSRFLTDLDSGKEDVNFIISQEENENLEISPTILANEMAIGLQNYHILDLEPSTSCGVSTSNKEIRNTSCSRNKNTDVNAGKKRRVTSTFTKTCMDFLLDGENDFSSGSSDLWSEKEESSSEEEESQKSKNRKKTKRKNTEKKQKEIVPIKKKKRENKRKIRKQQREKGLPYETLSGKVKESRKLQENPCKEQKCFRKCYEITEERRNSIFKYFWELSNEKKRDWIVQCCKAAEIKRKKTKNTVSRRSLSYEYYINEGEGRRQVCQQFIMKTLDVSQTYILYVLNHAKEGLSSHDSRTRTAVDKYDENTKLKAKNYIETLPALPSHYSRKNTTKLYLPQELKNLSNLYRLYVKHCQEKSENYLSEKVFINIFKEYNYAFHVPKKDKCSICTSKENLSVNPDTPADERLQTHMFEKEATYKRFHIHQNLKPDETLVVASFDLQKVLGTPYGESMMLYYSRKYAIYNFCIYESRTQNGYCYTWGEADGKRGSCEIATCLFKYLKEVDARGVSTLLLYCDNCTGQNKNKVVLSMIKQFLEKSKNLQVIQINYLLAGHTYMPVDSMHAIIEREVKNLIVWAPSQWSCYMESARKRPQPYRVNVLEHTDFIDFNKLADTVFTPATLKNKDLRIKHIRVCTFKKNDLTKIDVKYSMLENGNTYAIELSRQMQEKGKRKGILKKTSIRVKAKKSLDQQEVGSHSCGEENKSKELPPLYKKRLPISVAKYKDLKKLCNTNIIPKRFHHEYINLSNEIPVCDTLNETDDNDSEADVEDDHD